MNTIVKGVAEVVLNVHNLEKMQQFYQEVLGFTFHSQFPQKNPTIVFLTMVDQKSPLSRGGHPQMLVLIDPVRHPFTPETFIELDHKQSSLNHLAFEIDRRDYETEKSRLENLKLEVSTMSFPDLKALALFFKDPEGNLLELICHDVENFQISQKDNSSAEPTIKGVVELVINVHNIEKMQKFYQEVLGFEFHSQYPQQNPAFVFLKMRDQNSALSKGGHPEMLALVDPARHIHTADTFVGLNTQKSALNHLAFEIEFKDHSFAKKKLKSLGLQISTIPFPDLKALAIFFKNPEGNLLEFICHDESSVLARYVIYMSLLPFVVKGFIKKFLKRIQKFA